MSEKSEPPKKSRLQTFAKAAPTLFALFVMAGGWLLVHRINEAGQALHEVVSKDEEASIPDSITLPIGKLEAGRFEAVSAQSQPVQHVHNLPGRVRYDGA